MLTKEMIGVIVIVLTALLLIGISLPLLMGKGASLIAGYNTASPEEKARYDEKALCRFTGRLLLAIGLCTFLLIPAVLFNMAWLGIAYALLATVLSVFGAVYCNTGNRFRK